MSTGPFVLIGRGGYQPRSAWDLVQLRMRFGQWRKCLTVVTVGSSIVPQAIRQAISTSRSRRSGPVELQCVRHLSIDSQSGTLGPPLRRVVRIKNASLGCRTTQQTGSRRHIASAWGWSPPIYCCLGEHVDPKMLQGCLNVLGAYWRCDRHAASLTTLCRHRFRPLLDSTWLADSGRRVG
jgi:hypothetical protein